MTNLHQHEFDPRLDLMLERIVDISPEQLWSAWTNPELLVKWFAPKPWTTSSCEIDLRPGGKFRAVMRSPDGKESCCSSCFLEIVKHRKLVWTDALNSDYRPSQTPFITAYITFEPHGEGTKYTAMVLHRDEADKKRHEDMGFEQGWSSCIEQLVALFRPGIDR